MMWVPENEPCPEEPYDEKGATGGFVKKGRIKKYQDGGIASLTRDPRMGGAMNPADGYNFGFAAGGMPSMPEYQAGGKLLRGPGDGMSDDIPAVIRGKGVQRAALADGEFVIPARIVSELGNGSTDAGLKLLSSRLGAKPIKGRGDGMSDSISAMINGKQPARIADGEAYVPPEMVKKIGRGSPENGAKRLYKMMDKVRHARTGTKRQGKQIKADKYLPT
jgi:hypothetical protein